MVGPRLFATGPPMYGSRFFRPKQFRVMNTADDIRQTVQYNKDYGAAALKDYLTPNRRVRAELAAAARAAGLNLDVEPGGEGPTNFTRAIDGATGTAHGMGFTTVSQDVIKLLGATTMGITPTLIVTLDGPMGESYFYQGLDRELGSLEVGKPADLVVLARNPLENVRNAREVVYVMVNGVLYSGEDAARIHPDPAQTGKMYFAR
jgi:hypothetical protein